MKILASLLFFCFAQASPQHLMDAQFLVDKLDINNTSYEHGIGTVSFVEPYFSHTDCSGFVMHLLSHSYGYTSENYKAWLGAKRFQASDLHDTVEKQLGFTALFKVTDLQPGDFLVLKYADQSRNTGHVMLVSAPPVKIDPQDPIISNSTQWAVKIIDSSESGHGTQDKRHKSGANGKDHQGLGEGTARIYANSEGNIVGYTWSLLKISKFKSPDEEHMVMGRLIPEFLP